jgi:hypothetical protein
MKASELIELLGKAVQEHGDIPVASYYAEDDQYYGVQFEIVTDAGPTWVHLGTFHHSTTTPRRSD